jgi:hypothetical protein
MTVFACGSSGGQTNQSEESGVFVQTKEEYDYDNDGTIDNVSIYTYDANEKRIKEDYDDDNDGIINVVFYATWNEL